MAEGQPAKEKSEVEGTYIPAQDAISIRAILVVGVIAAILALRLDPQFSRPGPLSSQIFAVTNILLLYWGLYSVTMAVAIEEKPFGRALTRYCKGMAQNFFLVGVSCTVTATVLVLVPVIFPSMLAEMILQLGVGKILGIYLLIVDVVISAKHILSIYTSGKIPKDKHRSSVRDEIQHAFVVFLVILPLFAIP